MAQVIGVVKSIHGKAAVKKVNDQLVTLKVGDALHVNEMVYALGADSSVTLELEGGRTLNLNGYDEVLLDSSVFAALEKGESLDVDALRQAISAGEEKTDVGETAAGNEVVSDSNAGADFAVRVDGRGNVSSYLTGTDSGILNAPIVPDGLQILPIQNTAPNTTSENNAPDALNDTLNTSEDNAITIALNTLLANDTDPDGNPLTITSVQDTVNGSVSIVDGSVIFTPDANYNGPASFTYTVSDGQGGSDTATVTINVTPVNDNPTIESTIPAQILAEDFPSYTIDLNAAFADVETTDSNLAFSVSGNSNIHVSITDGIATITPTADWNGSETLQFTATDTGGLSVSQNVPFTVSAVVDIANDGTVDVPEEQTTILNVLGNDTFEGTPVVSATTDPANGSIVVNSNGTITYTPDTNYNGTDSFDYTVTSGGVTETATVTINVTPVNDAPIAIDDPASGDDYMTEMTTYTSIWGYDLNAGNDYTNENVTITAINGSSVDGSGPSMGVDGWDSNDSTQMINPTEGIQFVFNQDIKLALIDFNNFNSTQDDATWVIKNGTSVIDSSLYTASFNILPNGHVGDILTIHSDTPFDTIEIINTDDSNSFSIDQVLASNSGSTTLTYGSQLYFPEAELLSNDTDIDTGDTLSIYSASPTSALGATITMSDGNILYTPNDTLDITEITEDTFTYTITDGNGGFDTATVSVTLLPTSGDTYLGEILLIEGDHTIDLSNIGDMTDSISQINMKNGATALTNVSPDNVNSISDGTLYINGDADDSVSLTTDWSAVGTADGYNTYTATIDSSLITLHVDTDIIP